MNYRDNLSSHLLSTAVFKYCAFHHTLFFILIRMTNSKHCKTQDFHSSLQNGSFWYMLQEQRQPVIMAWTTVPVSR